MWDFIENNPIIPITVSNPFEQTVYPADGSIHATLDTGYTGFLLIPTQMFTQLKLNLLQTTKALATLADGTQIELREAHGTIEFPDLDQTIDGIIQTNPSITEALIGMDAIRNLIIQIDNCQRQTSAQTCEK